MASVCLPSDALSQHLPSYLGFSYLGRGVSLHSCSSKAQLLLLTLDEGYLLMAAPPDLEQLSPYAPRKGPVSDISLSINQKFPPGHFLSLPWPPQLLAFTALRQYCFSVQSLAGLSLPLYHELLKARLRVALFLDPQSFLQCLSNWLVK